VTSSPRSTGQPPDSEALAAVLAGLSSGQQVSLNVTKADGSTATVKMTLGQLPGT
jgi:hypothetical protein